MVFVVLDKIYKVTNSTTNEENGTQTAIVKEICGGEKSMISGIPGDVKLDKNTEIHAHHIDGNPSGSNDLLKVFECNERDECLSCTKLWKTETGYRHRTQKEKENTEKQDRKSVV